MRNENKKPKGIKRLNCIYNNNHYFNIYMNLSNLEYYVVMRHDKNMYLNNIIITYIPTFYSKVYRKICYNL